MANTKAEALNEIAKGIRGCFSYVALDFALHTTEKARLEQLRLVARAFYLDETDVKIAITPPIKTWIDSDYVGYMETSSRPWNNDQDKRKNKIVDMVNEAACCICKY